MTATPTAPKADDIAEGRGKAAKEPEGYRDDMLAFVRAVAPKALERGAAPYAPPQLLADRATASGEGVDLKQERAAFETWWRMWCPGRELPSGASHIFDAWLASARHRLACNGGK